MSRSLSLVLTVCNAEMDLANNLQHLFDVLADLTERFEILLIDEGSTDQTVETARELALRYPQLRMVPSDRQNAASAALDATLAKTTGDLVFIQSGHSTVRPSALRQLWEMGEGRSRQDGAAGTRLRPRRRLPGQPPRHAVAAEEIPSDAEIGPLRMIRRS